LKNRDTLFVVVRTEWPEFIDNHLTFLKGTPPFIKPTSLGAYASLERAEEVQGKYEQEMIDRGLGEFFNFEVQTVTYYEE